MTTRLRVKSTTRNASCLLAGTGQADEKPGTVKMKAFSLALLIL